MKFASSNTIQENKTIALVLFTVSAITGGWFYSAFGIYYGYKVKEETNNPTWFYMNIILMLTIGVYVLA